MAVWLAGCLNIRHAGQLDFKKLAGFLAHLIVI